MSYTVLNTILKMNSQDARFRAVCSALHGVMVAGGWVQTTDTGQLDPATVSAPVTQNTYATGYLMYRSDDAGGGLTELYVKVEIGVTNSTDGGPMLRFTAAFGGTNGAGAFLLDSTRQLQVSLAYSSTAMSTTIAYDTYWSAGSGWFVFAIPQMWMAICLERTRDENGALLNEFVFFYHHATSDSSTNQRHVRVINPEKTYPSANSFSCAVAPPPVDNHMYGTELPLGYQTAYSNKVTPPLISAFWVPGITSSTSTMLGMPGPSAEFDIESYGESHRYVLAFGPNSASVGLFQSNANGVLLRQE